MGDFWEEKVIAKAGYKNNLHNKGGMSGWETNYKMLKNGGLCQHGMPRGRKKKEGWISKGQGR